VPDATYPVCRVLYLSASAPLADGLPRFIMVLVDAAGRRRQAIRHAADLARDFPEVLPGPPTDLPFVTVGERRRSPDGTQVLVGFPDAMGEHELTVIAGDERQADAITRVSWAPADICRVFPVIVEEEMPPARPVRHGARPCSLLLALSAVAALSLAPPSRPR
jgi:hypothetical protein